MTHDPRHWQLMVLTGLLVYGLGWLDFDISAPQLVLTFATALSLQAVLDARGGTPVGSGLKSAAISSLSLCLLLRTAEPLLAAVAASIAIGSKFVLRANGRHVFNPTNFALAVMLAGSDQVWVSPGQWGSTAVFAFAMACLGGVVVTRAVRWDVTVTFLLCYAAIVVGRSLHLGEPLTIAWHRLQSGSLLLFSFFMISDPKTTPRSRPARAVFAVAVALGAAYVQFVLFRTNGLLWSLVVCSVFVPVLDRWLPGTPYAWHAVRPSMAFPKGATMRLRPLSTMLVLAATTWWSAEPLSAFCGFYVAKADAALYNQSSQVVLVRDGDRTVLTMVNDFTGPVREFAMVVPVPTFIERGQIHVAEKALVDHLDAFTAPRLVEYFDEDPCAPRAWENRALGDARQALPAAAAPRREKGLGVTIEASYTVGEYDILILSAEQSSGLATWLTANGYRLPKGATPVLASYIAQKMRFFVAKVNLAEHAKLGRAVLRPLQVAYESPKFMLPLRLGMVNANGPQDLIVYALSRQGRVEATNYRTVKLPTDVELPTYVRDPQEFARFHRAMFAEQVRKEAMHAVFVEHAWDMAWCDPCAADPLSADELRQLGVFWMDPAGPAPAGRGTPRAQDVFVTRLHVRYDAAHFPEDLVFQQTGDRTNYQGRYILRHPWKGTLTCGEATGYQTQLAARHSREAETLASLTGWPLAEIRGRMGLDRDIPAASQPTKWWERLWSR